MIEHKCLGCSFHRQPVGQLVTDVFQERKRQVLLFRESSQPDGASSRLASTPKKATPFSRSHAQSFGELGRIKTRERAVGSQKGDHHQFAGRHIVEAVPATTKILELEADGTILGSHHRGEMPRSP